MAESNRLVSVFMFDLTSSGLADIPAFMEIVGYHTRTGKWPSLPSESDPVLVNFNGQVNLRSAPLAQPSTLIAGALPSEAKLEVIGSDQSGYTPVRVWVFTPRVKVVSDV